MNSRNLYIDMLRGVSIVMVMLLHYSLSYRLHSAPLNQWISVPALRAIFLNGNYGVSVFFVISGFLITTNIVRRYGSLAGTDIVHFYKLRLFRLYPSVALALVIITVLGLAGLSNFSNVNKHEDFGNGFFVIANLSVLTFWHNILMERVGYFNYAMNIYWSLSVEEVFYLLYPLVLVVARRRWQLVLLACAAIVVGPAYRWIHSDDELFFMYGNLACVDMLVFGCAAAVAANLVTWTPPVRRVLAVLGFVAMGWVYMRGIGGNEAFGATQLGLAAAIFLVAVSRLPPGKLARRAGRPLAWLGSHSYELYLFHIVVLGVMVELVPRAAMTPERKLPMLALFLVLSAAFAWGVARFFGDPLNRRLRARFVRRKVDASRTAEPSQVGFEQGQTPFT
ncbi:peptidoglycan/LPS O-acetylase OafA/YrhL [Luteibacter sp. OK325]|uniref:acyltransferase family protein n=1 Tax=Luteibacter sp. OK325 TaxID=2135670 RepID=UPI000D369B6B|nr:acyltransferase [Luteibacter sp. OK325]PTR34147.1 peptidoglycan/LPS O-acetylase OafA/YrhL [Luteibacter sp. OK325]